MRLERSDRRSNLGRSKAEFALQWLIENQSPGYRGACWGNHFDYCFAKWPYLEGRPDRCLDVLIGHAFLDGYDHFQEDEYLQVAVSICEHIAHNWSIFPHGGGCVYRLYPGCPDGRGS